MTDCCSQLSFKKSQAFTGWPLILASPFDRVRSCTRALFRCGWAMVSIAGMQLTYLRFGYKMYVSSILTAMHDSNLKWVWQLLCSQSNYPLQIFKLFLQLTELLANISRLKSGLLAAARRQTSNNSWRSSVKHGQKWSKGSCNSGFQGLKVSVSLGIWHNVTLLPLCQARLLRANIESSWYSIHFYTVVCIHCTWELCGRVGSAILYSTVSRAQVFLPCVAKSHPVTNTSCNKVAQSAFNHRSFAITRSIHTGSVRDHGFSKKLEDSTIASIWPRKIQCSRGTTNFVQKYVKIVFFPAGSHHNITSLFVSVCSAFQIFQPVAHWTSSQGSRYRPPCPRRNR